MIFAATRGYVDRIELGRVEEFMTQLQERVRSDAKEAMDAIKDGDWSDGTQEKLESTIKQFAEDFGYDLDEEGQPLSDDAEDAATSRARNKDSEESSDADEKEEAAA